jgi:copper oxidase (laccase) domain-containing protein
VGDDVADRFDKQFVVARTNGKFLLDLAAANAAQLHDAGVRDVQVIGLCTKETDYLPSHRRNGDGQRFGAIVGIRPGIGDQAI